MFVMLGREKAQLVQSGLWPEKFGDPWHKWFLL